MGLTTNFFVPTKRKDQLPSTPTFWFDSTFGMSADLSTWQARVGDYKATQSNPGLRFTRGAKAGWLYSSPSQYMNTTPLVPLTTKPGISVLAYLQADNVGRVDAGQTIMGGGDTVLYIYNANLEMYINDRAGGGNNPTKRIPQGVEVVVGGIAQPNVAPGSVGFVNGQYSDGSNRYGALYGKLQDAVYAIGSVDGCIRHILLFDYVLTDKQVQDWTRYLPTILDKLAP